MQTVQDELAPAPASSLGSLADAAESDGPKPPAMPDLSADPGWPAGVGHGAAAGSPQLALLLSSTPTPAVPDTQTDTACAAPSALDLLAAAADQSGESAQQPAGLDSSARLSWPDDMPQGSASWAEAGGPDQAPLLSSTPTAAAVWGAQDDDVDTGHASPSPLDFLADAAAADESNISTQPSASAGFNWSAVAGPDAASDGSLTQPSKHAGMPLTMAQQQQCK